jgi:hypothetical protein
MVSWAEEFPQPASQQCKLLRKINKMREEWDKLWDLLLPLQYVYGDGKTLPASSS